MKRIVSLILLLAVSLTMAMPMGAAAATHTARTTIYDATSALYNNIDLAVEALDGVEVWADEVFSFNDIVGERTANEGYLAAINGRGVRVVGGGVSQVATTLYLALKKRGDVDYVEKITYGNNFTGRYVVSGADAIVTDYKNDNDFSFLNMGDAFTIHIARSGASLECTLTSVDDWDDDSDWEDDWEGEGEDDWDVDPEFSRWGDYIFPDSDYIKLTRREVLAIPSSEWGYARNEIYARHGYQFKTRKYREYFEMQDWYVPGGFSTKDLNATEWYNMELIKSLEQEYGILPGTSPRPAPGTSGSYIFPDSSRRRLTRREVLDIPQSQWGYARNEIYARHGYRFQTKKYADYFANKRWYAPGGFNTKDLNETEWYNMELIKSLEDEYGVK